MLPPYRLTDSSAKHSFAYGRHPRPLLYPGCSRRHGGRNKGVSVPDRDA
jgi:hypothetical protein